MALSRELGRMFALGAATLMFEVLLTRIAAVTLFANLAFGVIALSLLGLAVGSAWAERSKLVSDAARERAIASALLCAGFFSLLSALVATQLPLVPDELVLDGHAATSFLQRRTAFEQDPRLVRWSLVTLLVIAQGIPFAMVGYAQAQAFARAAQRSSMLYAADLAGATLGSIVTIGLLRVLGAADGVSVVAALFVVAATFGGRGRWFHLCVGGLTVCIALVAFVRPFDIRHAAGFTEDRIVAVDWSALARIGLYDRSRKIGSLGEPLLVVDNTSATDVAFAKDERFGENLERIPYLLRPTGDVLVIGAGGGQEIETALATAPGRNRHVDAVELADGEERLMRRFFGKRPDFILEQPGVSYRIADGRSFLEMSSRHWDVIQMKEVNFHSFAGQAASAWTPTLLFTAEAMKSELLHLGPNGLLSMTRGLYLGGDLATTLQIVSTIRKATDDLGWELDPRLVIVDRPKSAGFQRMCIVSVAPFTDEELSSIHAIAAHSGLVVRRTPLQRLEGIDDVVVRHDVDASRVLRDDQPFPALRQTDARILFGGVAFLFFLAVLLVLSSVRRAEVGERAQSLRQLLACGLLGIGFMLLEVILVERTSMLVGHPTIGFVAVVTSSLCGLGIGSMLSTRFLPGRALVATWVLASVAMMAVAPVWFASAFRNVDAMWRPWLVGLVMLAGAIPLGTLLPSILRSAVAARAACWSVNASCSVLGTLSAALFVRTMGFTKTSWLAWLVYAAALGLMFGPPRREPQADLAPRRT